jgi:UTP--glucose-1-phosphate uridylyltransferase
MKSPVPVRKAVFPAAGLGTRFLPATKAQPKEMLPLVDKPIIQYVVEEAVASGITSIVIVTGRGKTAIENHFDVAYELEHLLERRAKLDLLEEVRAIGNLIDIAYVRQKEPLGLGHAILMARDVIGHEPFAVFLADDIITSEVPAMKQLIDVYQARHCSVVAVERVSRQRTSDYGIVAARPAGDRLFKVTDLVEKPPPEEAPSDLAIIGRYVLMPEIFEHLAQTAAGRGGEIQLTDGLRSLLRRQEICAYRFRGQRYDTGDKLGFLKATVEIALQRPDLGERFRRYLRGLDLAGGAAKPPEAGGARKTPAAAGAARPKRRRRSPAARRPKRRS